MARCNCAGTIPGFGFLPTNNGPVADATFPVPPPVGTMVLDTSTNTIYVKVDDVGGWTTIGPLPVT